jgi:tetratricopeptide (TPR) repeat protein
MSSLVRTPAAPLLLALLGLGCLGKAAIHQRAVDEVYRGYEYYQKDDLERAEVAFNHALEFNKDFPEAWNGLGLIAFTRGNLDAAKQHFQRAIRINSDFAEAHGNLGRVYLSTGRLSQAEDELVVALKINPDYTDARYNYAVSLLRQGWDKPKKRKDYWARARKQFLHLLEAKQDAADPYHHLGFMEYESGNYYEAEKLYRQAVELAPTYMEALHGLCIALVRLQRCNEAVGFCQKALDVAPHSPECKKSLEGAKRCAGGEVSGAGR